MTDQRDQLPEKVTCPNCSNTYSLEDSERAESEFRCPDCGKTYQAKDLANVAKQQRIQAAQLLKQDFPEGAMASSHFKSLFALGSAISGLGWPVMIAGILCFVIGLVSLFSDNPARVFLGTVLAPAGFFALLNGVVLVATGKAVQCLVAIEYNTRSTWEIIKMDLIGRYYRGGD